MNPVTFVHNDVKENERKRKEKKVKKVKWRD
jgi:hypothetical protein